MGKQSKAGSERDASGRPDEALGELWRTEDPWRFTQGLADLAHLLSPDDKAKALKRLSELSDGRAQATALRALYPHLPAEGRRTAERIAASLKSPALALSLLIDQIPAARRKEVAEKAWAKTSRARDESERAEALANLLPHVPAAARTKAASFASMTKDPAARCRIETALAEVEEEQEEKARIAGRALESAKSIQEPELKVDLLIRLARILPEPERVEAAKEALSLAWETSEPAARAERLAALAGLLPDRRDETVKQVLESIRSVESEWTRAGLIMNLAGQIPREALPALEDEARRLADPGLRAEVLEHFKSVAHQKITGEKDPLEAPPGSSKPAGRPPQPAPRRERVPVRVHPDVPAHVDELNRGPFADVLAETLRDIWTGSEEGTRLSRGERPGRAFILHLRGPWGSGKSSVLNFLRDRLESGPRSGGSGAAPAAKKERWIVVDFNAWRHQRAALPWWALLRTVYHQCRNGLLRQKSPRATLIWLVETQWRLRTDLAPYLLAGAVLIWVGSLAAGYLAGESAPSFSAFVNWLKPVSDVTAALLAASGVLFGALRTLMHGSPQAVRMLTEIGRDPLRALSRHFRTLVKCAGRPIAILIDDLDRCESKYVIELLRGIQTLFHEAGVAYVVAADREWLRASYEMHYREFEGAIGEPGRRLGYLFLDKLFEASVTLPHMAPERQKAYWERLIDAEGVMDPEKDADEEEKVRVKAEGDLKDTLPHEDLLRKIREAESDPRLQRAYRAVAAKRVVSRKGRERARHVLQRFAPLLEPNPRAIKRLVNAYAYNQAVNLISERDVEIGALVRWTILETRWPHLAHHLERHPEDIDTIEQSTPPSVEDELLRPLWHDAEVVSVVKGSTGDDDPGLGGSALRRILGVEGSGQERSSEAEGGPAIAA